MNSSTRNFSWLRIGMATLLTLAASFGVFAQSTAGNIGGDSTPGDTVQVTNSKTGFNRQIVVNKDGKYRFGNVPVGTYQVVIKRNDAVVLNTAVNVLVGRTSRVLAPTAGNAPDAIAQPQSEPAPAGGQN